MPKKNKPCIQTQSPRFFDFPNQLIPKPEPSFISIVQSVFNLCKKAEPEDISLDQFTLSIARMKCTDAEIKSINKFIPGKDFLALIDGDAYLMHANSVSVNSIDSLNESSRSAIIIDVNKIIVNADTRFSKYVTKYLEDNYISSYEEMTKPQPLQIAE